MILDASMIRRGSGRLGRPGALSFLLASIATLGLGCGDDDAGDDPDTGVAASTVSAGDDSGGDCAPDSIPGCEMPVEVCEGGACQCLCGDAGATSGASSGGAATGAGDSGGELCTDEVSGDTPVCDTPQATCDTIGGCCRCDTFAGCGDEPVWMCIQVVPDPACPGEVPDVGSTCDSEGASCQLCDASGPTVRQCTGGTWQEGGFSCI